MKRLSVLGWFRILRAHHQWTMFEAIRYALLCGRAFLIDVGDSIWMRLTL